MSIISDALKKAQEKDEDFRPRRGLLSGFRAKNKRSFYSAWRGAFPIVLVIGLTGAIGGSFYFVLFQGVDTAKAFLFPGSDQVVQRVVSRTQKSVSESSEDTVGGIGRYSIEERPFHQVAGFTAKSSDPLFILSGIARNEDGYLAVINDRILSIGDIIEGAIIKDITLEHVELEMNDQRIVLERSL